MVVAGREGRGTRPTRVPTRKWSSAFSEDMGVYELFYCDLHPLVLHALQTSRHPTIPLFPLRSCFSQQGPLLEIERCPCDLFVCTGTPHKHLLHWMQSKGSTRS